MFLALAWWGKANAAIPVDTVTKQMAQTSADTVIYLYLHGAGMLGLKAASENCWKVKDEATNLDCMLFDIAAHNIDAEVIQESGGKFPEFEYFSAYVFFKRVGQTVVAHTPFRGTKTLHDGTNALNDYLSAITDVVWQYEATEYKKMSAWR